MKKKVLFIIPSLNAGGAEKSLVNLLNHFNYEEYEVDLFCKLLAEKFNYNPNSIFDKLFMESRKGLSAKDIYKKFRQ